MRNYTYKVVFVNENVPDSIVHTRSTEQAKILGQAEKIKDGLDYRVAFVIQID